MQSERSAVAYGSRRIAAFLRTLDELRPDTEKAPRFQA
jgi:hypothetical protein